MISNDPSSENKKTVYRYKGRLNSSQLAAVLFIKVMAGELRPIVSLPAIPHPAIDSGGLPHLRSIVYGTAMTSRVPVSRDLTRTVRFTPG